MKAHTSVRAVSQKHFNIGAISGIKHLARAKHGNKKNSPIHSFNILPPSKIIGQHGIQCREPFEPLSNILIL
jgi:hypothetical protein